MTFNWLGHYASSLDDTAYMLRKTRVAPNLTFSNPAGAEFG